MSGNGEDRILPVEEAVDGKTEMIVRIEKGQVILRFAKPMQWIAFDPANAVTVGKHLIDCAVQCGAKVTIQTPKRKITRETRERLIARAMHVFRSMSERGKTPADIAKNVVDTILSAID